MACNLCGGQICALSRRLDSCRDCGAKYIAFDVNRPRGSLYREWADRETQRLEAKIGQMIFQSGFEDNHKLDGLTDETLFIVRIRALRQYIARMS